MNPQIIIDQDTTLSLVDSQHVPEFLALIDSSREYLREWLGWLDNTRTISDLEKFIEACAEEFEAKKGMGVWIWNNNKIVGIMHLREVDHINRKAMMGYWTGQAYRGRGFAKRACKAMVNFAFKTWGLNRIEIRCATGNSASQSIPVSLGFQREGVLRDNEWLYDHHVDHVVFSMLKKDWKE